MEAEEKAKHGNNQKKFSLLFPVFTDTGSKRFSDGGKSLARGRMLCSRMLAQEEQVNRS
jgi:hypothetical protein